MLKDLDETVKELLTQKYLTLENKTGQIDIVFNRPDKEWEGTVTRLTINLFLYDIRENLQLRGNERYLTRNGTTGTETYAATRMDFTYLISVWSKASSTVEIEEEHEVLGKVLTTLLAYPILPPEVLQGEIRQQSQPPRAWIAQPEDTPKTWEFWGSNEWRLKAGISYRVTLHIEPKPVDVGLVTETEIQLKLTQQINSP
jgi:hypothetical protein